MELHRRIAQQLEPVLADLRAAGEWDESKHPRGKGGKFATSEEESEAGRRMQGAVHTVLQDAGFAVVHTAGDGTKLYERAMTDEPKENQYATAHPDGSWTHTASDVTFGKGEGFKSLDTHLGMHDFGDSAPAQRPDSRDLFDSQTTRKPDSWSEVGGRSWDDLTGTQRDAIRTLPVVDMDSRGPMQNHPAFEPGSSAAGRGPIEFLVNTPNGNHFYVNTEGYKYARYVMRVDNLPPDYKDANPAAGRLGGGRHGWAEKR